MRSGLKKMQQTLKNYQQSADTVSKEDSVTIPKLEHRTADYVSMLVTMCQMLQDTGNLNKASYNTHSKSPAGAESVILSPQSSESQGYLQTWNSVS